MSAPNHWTTVVRSIETDSPFLSVLRVQSSRDGGRDERQEALPDFLKIAVAIAAQSCRAPGRPLRLAMVAPRWEEGALWTAVGVALCLLKSDFESASQRLPPLVAGRKYKLDRDKVVQFEGENSDGLRLRVDGGAGFLTIKASERMRLQPTDTRLRLSSLAWAGSAPPDLLDDLLGIKAQGARHIFSTRVALVSGLARSLESARGCEVSVRGHDPSAPLPASAHLRARAEIGRVKARLARRPAPTHRLMQLLESAAAIAAAPAIEGANRQELGRILAEALKRAEAHADTEIHGQRALLESLLKLVQPAPPSEAAPQSLLDLFQWGRLDEAGQSEILSNGQVEAPPVMLLSHDLLPLRAWLRAQAPDAVRPLIVLDGASSFRNRSNDLKTLLEVGAPAGAPVVACLDRGQQDEVGALAAHGFEVWKWLPDDLKCFKTESAPLAAPVFGSLLRAHRNYAHHQLSEHGCESEPIENAAAALMSLVADLDAQSSETKALESALYRALLYTARLLHRCDGTERRARELLNEAQSALADCSFWLDDAMRGRASEVASFIESAIGEEGGKADGLRDLVRRATTNSVAVVVLPETVELARARWQEWSRDDADLRAREVAFCCHATVQAQLRATRSTHLIICGWLGAGRMRALLDGCLAADISLLLYPFERGWLRGALRRWRGAGDNLSDSRILALLGLKRTDLTLESGASGREPLADLMDSLPAREERASEFDAGEYEARLHVHRRANRIVARAGEETEPARLIEFSGGDFAFLTASYRLPLVSDLVAMARGELPTPKNAGRKTELPQPRADQLAVGDYVVFRAGRGGDLIRDMADIVLRRAGAGELREVAGLWKCALREWVEEQSERALERGVWDAMPTILGQLSEAGISRGEQTIRYWLDPDSQTIGPQSPEIIVPAIARVTGDAELQRQLPAVLDAIGRVRNAHFSASDELKRALHARLPAFLARQSADSFLSGALEVEIEGVGRAFVVRVEEIAAETAPVPRSQLNVLQREES